jgi:uncharacterized RDD family membrane protein YckC
MASFGMRAAAWIVDAIPHAGVIYIVGRATASIVLTIVAGVLVGVVWSIIPEARHGATLGKLFAGIRTVDPATGAPIGYLRAAVRWIVKYPICLVLFVGYLLYFRDATRRTLADFAARSRVVSIVSPD